MHAIAARSGSPKPQFISREPPRDPNPGEVICRTIELGLCGTDRDILASENPWVPANDDLLILGHECLARVECVGEGVTGYCEGDLVVPTVRRPATATVHRVDLLAFGSYTERGIVFEHGFSAPLWLDRPEYLFPVDESIRELAILTEPLSVAEKGANEAQLLQEARLGAGTWSASPPRVLVTGMGPIGFACVLAAQSRGWPVALFGRDPRDSFRASLALELGADYLPATDDPLSLRNVENEGFDLILECTGSDEVLLRSASCLRARGVVVWLGCSRIARPARHNVAALMRQTLLGNHLHIGSVNSAPRDFRDALTHLRTLKGTRADALAKLITARVAPEESLWHYENREPQGIKTVLIYP